MTWTPIDVAMTIFFMGIVATLIIMALKKGEIPVHIPTYRWMNRGFPPELTWEKATKLFKWTAFWDDLPSHCYVCNDKCIEGEMDYVTFGDRTGQHMVVTRTCPNGHGFNVWIA